ncbi:MAG: DNA-directed DNA polymerase II small subunit [Euryarchaeota archaeon]|nr:DNA-directed DNA polymerase II small subunit [Euryarchaeota archaeon]
MGAEAAVDRVQIVRFFGRFDCLIEPALVDHLSALENPEERAEAVLQEMGEVPFYLTLAAFREAAERLERRRSGDHPDEAAPADDGTSHELEAARKAALAKMLSLVYDPHSKQVDDEAEDDTDEGDEAATKRAPWEVDPDAPIVVNRPSTWRPVAADYAPDIKVLQDVTGNSTCEGTTDDFHRYFKARFHQMERLLKKRRELANALPVEKVSTGGPREVAMIGMVTENRLTPNGHRILQLEDETGMAPLLVANNERTDPQLMVAAGLLVPDEVIGVIGRKTAKGDLVIVEDIIRPDIPFNTERRHAEVPLAAAFLSDIHVGSDLFLEKNFHQVIKWLNGETGNSREREMAGRIKYLVLPGDMVDGIGIYPGQDKHLKVGDIYDQYSYLSRLLESLPDHLEVIVQPGNHDAVRPIEPQPAFDKDVTEKFDPVNATFIGNPAVLSLDGVRVLSYHGCSLMDFATAVQGLEHHDPLPIMEEMLKCRHMAPIYGQSTPLAPEHKDYMVIETIPELFVTGHVHTFDTREYRGVQMMNCSTWQAQTDYQKMLNFKPDPCRLPIFDLKHLKATHMDFTMGMDFSFGAGEA